MHCRVILQVAMSTLYINKADGHVWYGITSLENTSVPSNLYEFACNQMIGEHSSYEYVGRATRYRTVYRVRHYFEGWIFRTRFVTQLVPYTVIVLRCYTQLLITDGPTIYDGILAIHTRNGVEKVCIEQSSDARLVCNHLGYQQYTTSHYQEDSVHGIQTTLVFNASRDVITNNTKSCLHRIICRQRCLAPPIPNGSAFTCLIGYERQFCAVRCNPGSAGLQALQV